jgi:carotenoid cleavage dioxygenase-like enzyme
MMHDFAITERFAVFVDHALVFDGAAMVRKGSLPFTVDKSRPSRIGLLSRAEPGAPVQWFDVPPFVFFHVANAWEADGKVHVVLCRCEACPDPAAHPPALALVCKRIQPELLNGAAIVMVPHVRL